MTLLLLLLKSQEQQTGATAGGASPRARRGRARRVVATGARARPRRPRTLGGIPHCAVMRLHRVSVVQCHLRPVGVLSEPPQVTGADSAHSAPCTTSPEGVELIRHTLENERAAWRARICEEAHRLQQEPLFQYDPVIDQEQFRRDGILVLPAVYTELAATRLTHACQRIQRLNDKWVNKDWLDPLAVAGWVAAGLRPPTRLASAELRETMTGGTQLGARDSSSSPGLFDGSDFKGLQEDKRAPYLQGYCPEAFACGYDAMMLNAYTHPQMLALQRQMLGADLRFDHWYGSIASPRTVRRRC